MCMSSSFFFFFKQKTAYEMRISDWSSDVCSSDLSIDFIGVIGMDHDDAGPRQTGQPVQQFVIHPLGQDDRQAGMDAQAADVFEVAQSVAEIGRASCRERVCQYV